MIWLTMCVFFVLILKNKHFPHIDAKYLLYEYFQKNTINFLQLIEDLSTFGKLENGTIKYT